MHRYKNLGGKSSVAQYHIAHDAVTIRFTDHSEYIYTNQSVTPANIEKMRTLALAGKGLGTFVEKMKDNYTRKVR